MLKTIVGTPMKSKSSKSGFKKTQRNVRGGKLRIADHWNAISIIANSQGNPLKAVAEFVENSIDARAEQIVIIRGKKRASSTSKSATMVRAFPGMRAVCPIFAEWQRIFATL